MSVETSRPVDERPPITRTRDARAVALAAYDQLIELLESLGADDWRAPTECPAWDVAAMTGHLIGAAEAGARIRENLRQQAWGRRHAAEFNGNSLDAVNALQVEEHAGLSPDRRIAALHALVPAAVAGRMRLPRPLRSLRVPVDPGGSTAEGMPTHLTLGRLVDVVYTRDVWLHTVDIARATGRRRPDGGDAERHIIEDVVVEWAGRHGQPFALELSGARTLRFHQGGGGGQLRLDAVEFCRVLSGRADPDDVAVDAEPAHAAGLLATRVLF